MKAKIETVLYKIILIISCIVWIKSAMPDSENGKKIGIVLVFLSIVFCLCISKIAFSSAVSISTKRRILLCTAIIGVYYMCTFYSQYNNRENILVKLIIIAVLQLPAIVFTICSLLGLTDIKIIDSVNGITGMAKRINEKLPFIGVFAIFVVILYSFSYSIWFDETFTLGIIQHSYSELVYLTGCDVHPPMYYILLKGFADGIGFLLPDVPVIYCARFFSSIPYIVLLSLLLIRRKKSDEKLSLNIMLLMFCMPNIMDYGIEVRMYSLALALVLVAYMIGYRIYYEDDNRWTNWIALAIVSLLSIYTHYYCGICIIAIYFLLFFKELKTKEVVKCLISGCILVIGYVPWLKVLFSTLASVSDRTWPETVSFKTVFESIWFWVGYYGAIIVVVPIVLWGFAAFRKSKKKNAYVLMGVLLPLILMGIGELVSAFYTPVWQKRYMVIAIGCMWFAVAQYAKELTLQKNKIRIIPFMVAIGLINIFIFVRHEQSDKIAADEVAKEVLEQDSEMTIVTGDTEIAYSVATAMDRKCIFSGQIGAYLESIYSENLQVLPDATEELIEKMKPVLFLSKDSEEIPDKSDDRVINGIIFREVR